MPDKSNRRKHHVPIPARLPKVNTINDLFARADINSIINELDKEKTNMSDLVVVWLNKYDHKYYFMVTEETLVSTATWMLEATKLDVINEDLEDD